VFNSSCHLGNAANISDTLDKPPMAPRAGALRLSHPLFSMNYGIETVLDSAEGNQIACKKI
jgi:hypothetical protein